MKKLWMRLEEKIQRKYKLREPEWVQVHITRNRKIHVTIVSDQPIDKKDIKELIQTELYTQEEEFLCGFINIYTLDMAEKLDITKMERSNGTVAYTWADGLASETKKSIEPSDANIISFYSYKGGVGRTIALIQTAYNLVKEGKRVLLLDLDIEAPSLHKLFATSVNDVVTGVSYGIVEYLYRSVVQKEKEVMLEEIFCPVMLDEVPGAMYLIPALKEMNERYIYEIGRLQTEQVKDREIFATILKQIRDELNIDFILIDTRAGFNPWGALSLLALSTQVIFIAYPNMENIEGLNYAIKMMDKLGEDRYAVAMSKVVGTQRGLEKAKELFSQLPLKQDGIIPILYKEEIALSNSYPIREEEIADAYRELSDYILDNDRIVLNKKYLNTVDKEQFLRNMFSKEHKSVAMSDVQRFIKQEQLTLLIYRFEEELYTVENRTDTRYEFHERDILRVKEYILYDPDKTDLFDAILAEPQMSTEARGILLAKEAIKGTFLEKKIEVGRLDSIEHLRDGLKEVISGEDILMSNHDSIEKKYEVTSGLILCINIEENCLGENAALISERIRDLILVFNRATEKIQFKFLLRQSIWKDHQQYFKNLKGSTMEVGVTKNDIHRLIFRNIDKDLFQPYLRASKSSQRYRIGSMAYPLDNGDYLYEDDLDWMIELIIGIRKFTTTYSSSVEQYIVDFFKQNKNMRLDQLMDVFDLAINLELEGNTISEGDRLIAFDNLEKALNDVCNQNPC